MHNLSTDTVKDVLLNRETAVFHAHENIPNHYFHEYELCQFPFDDIYE